MSLGKMIMIGLFGICEAGAALGFPRSDPPQRIWLEPLGLMFYAISLVMP